MLVVAGTELGSGASGVTVIFSSGHAVQLDEVVARPLGDGEDVGGASRGTTARQS